MDKVILKIIIFAIALLLKDVSSNRCISKQTCGECIAEHSECAWCSQENFGYNGSPRCDSVRNLVDNDCDYEYINDPMNSLVILENEELGQGNYRASGVNQIRPQWMKIALRPNSIQRFRVEYLHTAEYPLDIYLFMDLSTAEDKQKMVQLGHVLAEELPKITSNLRVGFGTFVYKQRESCIGCTPYYVFQNVMSLSDDTSRFAHMIEEAPESVNMDGPDGGVDAIMKAILCKEEIGWRLISRKIILYVSDTYYNYTVHVHGQLDEKATRNHDFCHLDSNGFFSEGTGHDYPTPNLMNYYININDMHIIFAVTSHQRPIYDVLSGDLKNSSIGTLDGDLTNIIDLIRHQYYNTRPSVDMRDNVYDDRIKLTYSSKCLGSKLEKTSICKELIKGNNVTFEVEIELTSCPPKHKKMDKRITIYPIGVRSQLMVYVEMLCECDCEKHGISELNSSKCNRYGTFECGICTCNENSFGKNCECSRDIYVSSHMDCKENVNDTFLCSGRGDCVCGACNCFHRQNPEEIVYGKFCECDNFSCDTHDGELCSGHGICDCGECVCRSGWTGSGCSCRDDDVSCFNGQWDDTPANNEEDASYLDGIYLLLMKMGLMR